MCGARGIIATAVELFESKPKPPLPIPTRFLKELRGLSDSLSEASLRLPLSLSFFFALSLSRDRFDRDLERDLSFFFFDLERDLSFLFFDLDLPFLFLDFDLDLDRDFFLLSSLLDRFLSFFPSPDEEDLSSSFRLPFFFLSAELDTDLLRSLSFPRPLSLRFLSRSLSLSRFFSLLLVFVLVGSLAFLFKKDYGWRCR